VAVSLSSALSLDIKVGYSLTVNIPSYSEQILISPVGSINFPAGTTSNQITFSLNSTLSDTTNWLNLQATFQLLPPTPELLVFLEDDSSSLSVGIFIAPQVSSSTRMLSSWFFLFSHLCSVFFPCP